MENITETKTKISNKENHIQYHKTQNEKNEIFKKNIKMLNIE